MSRGLVRVCARCGHETYGCPRCGKDDPILGGFIGDAAYCHTFVEAGQVSCYTAQLREDAAAARSAPVRPRRLLPLSEDFSAKLRAALEVSGDAVVEMERVFTDLEAEDADWASSDVGMETLELYYRVNCVRESLRELLER